MSNTLISRYRGRIVFAAIAYALWYLVFEWPIILYPSYAEGPCYSPNRDYHIISHQTLWQATFRRDPIAFGTARLFDRSGKLLYEKEAYIGGEVGPFWLDMPENNPTFPSKAFYVDAGGPGWIFSLPTSPGKEIPFESCYSRKLDLN